VKYSIKLRRETQRLMLLEQGVAVPPTRVLDHEWTSVSQSVRDVRDRLHQIVPNPSDRFVVDLLAQSSRYARKDQTLA
jgi:hypothetical protein